MDPPITITVLGLRRSGNHAIINWIIANYNNNRLLDHIYHPKATILTNSTKDIIFFNNCQKSPYFNLPPPNNTKLIIHSYEDKTLEYVKEYGPKSPSFTIIIIRDILNTFASRLKYNSPLTPVDEYHIDLWESYKGANRVFPKALFISYDKWLMDKEYRDEIAKFMEIPNYDNVESVSFCGNGSSFIGMKLEEDKEKYLTRYKGITFPPDIEKKLNSKV